MKEIVEKVLKSFVSCKMIKSFNNVSSIALWNKMSIKEKIMWFWFNKINFSKGKHLRSLINIKYNAEVLVWHIAHPDEDIEDCPIKLEYPYYLEPNPESIVIINMSFVPLYHISSFYITENKRL